MHFPLPRGSLPWVRVHRDSALGRERPEMDLPTQKPQMLSQELSDLIQLTSGWLTLATGSSYKASWEKTAGFGL